MLAPPGAAGACSSGQLCDHLNRQNDKSAAVKMHEPNHKAHSTMWWVLNTGKSRQVAPTHKVSALRGLLLRSTQSSLRLDWWPACHSTGADLG